MLVRKQRKRALKQSNLRHLEYYGMQETFDKLYASSKNSKIFTNLIEIIRSEENIKLAYRNIKKNAGSNTCGVDELTIKDIKMLTERVYRNCAEKDVMVQTKSSKTCRNSKAKWKNKTTRNSDNMGQNGATKYPASIRADM